MKLVLAIGAIVLGPPALWLQYHSAAETEALYRLYYDRGVVATCGLETQAVLIGFGQARAASEDRLGLDPAEVDAIRRDALTAADREWYNRGIGGIRSWCAVVGREAAERLADAVSRSESR